MSRYADLMNSTSFTDVSNERFEVQYLSVPVFCYDMASTANTVTWKVWDPIKKKFEEQTETSKRFDDGINRNVFYKYCALFLTISFNHTSS